MQAALEPVPERVQVQQALELVPAVALEQALEQAQVLLQAGKPVSFVAQEQEPVQVPLAGKLVPAEVKEQVPILMRQAEGQLPEQVLRNTEHRNCQSSQHFHQAVLKGMQLIQAQLP